MSSIRLAGSKTEHIYIYIYVFNESPMVLYLKLNKSIN